jgi:hypothetical protein
MEIQARSLGSAASLDAVLKAVIAGSRIARKNPSTGVRVITITGTNTKQNKHASAR